MKQPGREVDYSPPPSAKVKNKWSCTSIPLSFHGLLLELHSRTSFYLAFSYNEICVKYGKILPILFFRRELHEVSNAEKARSQKEVPPS
jgi:hypothetical protein